MGKALKEPGRYWGGVIAGSFRTERERREKSGEEESDKVVPPVSSEKRKKKGGGRGLRAEAGWAAARPVWPPGRPKWDGFLFFCSNSFSFSVSLFLLYLLDTLTKQGQTNF
jgi:hypothetical protein